VELIALDLLAQAEHGEDSPLWLISPDHGLVKAVLAEVARLAPERPTVGNAQLEALPVGSLAEALADRVTRAGCVFVGAGAGTAFGDYVAGSNHVLPTGGAARFQSALSPATFRRRMARVSLPGEAPARLAPAGAALARAEGFPVHAESMERRA
jgi:histidinol dehydrogenase